MCTYLTLLSFFQVQDVTDRSLKLFLKLSHMAELFSKGVILHFPAEIYLKRGVGELFPLLVRALDQSQIVAMHFLRVGCVRVTVRTQAYREKLLKPQFMFEDVIIPIRPADRVVKVVYVRDLPFDLSVESVQFVFSVFGEVYSVQFVYHKEFPTICTGTRTVLMSVQVPVPSTVNVLGFDCIDVC